MIVKNRIDMNKFFTLQMLILISAALQMRQDGIILFAQDDALKKDSLFVYTVVDKDITAFLDTFIVETCSIDYPSKDYFIYVELGSNGFLSIILDCRKQKESSDSIILFTHPYYHQAFILHQDILFRANFASMDVTNYCKLTEILEKAHKKQCVYFKNPSPNFYDNSGKGEIDYEDMLMSWLVDYYYGKGQDIFKVYFYLEDK